VEQAGSLPFSKREYVMNYAANTQVQNAIGTPRTLEMQAISHITHQLVAANTPDADPLDRTRALNGNLKLWSMLVEDLSDPGNTLPDPIKGSYISLGMFAHRASLKALTAEADLAPLIRINVDVLEALNQQRLAA
jgi:flagellar biosynthesis regulator FlaF